MSYQIQHYPQDKASRYDVLIKEADALTAGISHPIVHFANIAALLWHGLPDINWCGFYLLDSGALLLSPFCGLPACISIPIGHGVCGTAVSTGNVQRVPDVHAFPGHIACDSASNSEIVLPIRYQGRVIGVLDIDSPSFDRFDEIDEEKLRQLVDLIETRCDFERTGYTL